MSSIDAVVAQAQRPGNFTERKRFTLARSQAIQKLRQFALADPAGYILELIQSAIANGASWIEIQREPDSVTLAYIGGGIPEASLGRLFDFLFASKDRADLGYLRELAIGVNALMVYMPKKIIIESGDGTRAGTTRMELLAGEDRLDVGRPDHALAGTFIRAEGLRKGNNDSAHERGLIETRCLAAPVPILFNGEAVFGHSTRRIPGLLGFRKHMSFDEGDLYGAIGIRADIGGRAEFSLLTRGVLVESVEHPLIDSAPLGGVICFDSLRKSADHARVVRDERYEEMWLRVRPYARALLGTQEVRDVVSASEFDGQPLGSVQALRAWVRAAGRVVVVSPALATTGPRADEARAIAASLQARLLAVWDEHITSLRILGGSGVEIHTPRLGSGDREFYQRDPARPPPRPWLVQPVDVPAVTLTQLGSQLLVAALARALGEASELRMRVYTPAAAEHRDFVEVLLHSSGRLLARHTLPSLHAGHVLVVDLPIVAPSQLVDAAAAGLPNASEVLAEVCLRHAEPALAEAAERVLASLVDPRAQLGALERHRALAALARSATPRLRRVVAADGTVHASVCLSLFDPAPPGVDLLGLPLFTAASGKSLCARDLAAVMTATGGWLLGAHAGAQTPGDPELDHVLLVDAVSEPLVIGLVGEAAYLRVDGTCPKGHGPAAIDGEGRCHDAAAIEAALAAGRVLVAHYCHELPDAATDAAPAQLPAELWLAPWAFLRLAPLGTLLPAFDFHLGDAEAREHGDELAFIAASPVRGPEPCGTLDGQLGVPLAEPGAPGVLLVDEQLRPLHRYGELGHDHGVVGLLRVRGAWSEAREEAVAAAVEAATTAVYEELLARVPAMDPHGPAFARATTAMLAHAGRRVHFIADEHGQLRVAGVSRLADRVLALPLFPGRRGLPLGAWQPIRRFAASGGDIEAALAEIDLQATAPVLREWLRRTLAAHEAARTQTPAAPVEARPALLELDRDGRTRPVAEAGDRTPLDEVTLATTLEYWLHHLRPDARSGPRGLAWDRRGHVWIELEVGDRGEEFASVTGDSTTWSVTLRREHWLVRWALACGRRDREAVVWLLLACYARVNEAFDDVTNHHEGQFQRAVADALADGRLAIVTPRLG